MTYALSPSTDNFELVTGLVTRLSAWFTIKFRSGMSDREGDVLRDCQ